LLLILHVVGFTPTLYQATMKIFGFHMAVFQWLNLPFTSTMGLLKFQHLSLEEKHVFLIGFFD
jgi:hypothetical protein